MDPIENPFSPGAGCPPPALEGRRSVIEQARVLIARILKGKAEQSLLLTGLRGVGKTVLLNKMEHMAGEAGYRTILFEAQEKRTLSEILIPKLKNVLYDLDRIAKGGRMVKQALVALRNFVGSVKLSYDGFGLELEPLPGIADSGDIELDMPELFLAVAEAAREKEAGVALMIDEIQNVTSQEWGALIMSMHKLQQRQAPMLLIGAGLPTLPRVTGEVKSYAERLFSYPIIGQLKQEDAFNALIRPVEKEGCIFEKAAVEAIYRKTVGYPYFLQVWGYQVWNEAQDSTLRLKDVEAATPQVMKRLDENFFRVRYERLSNHEKKFMKAMAEIKDGDRKISDVASIMGKNSSSLSPVRAQLMQKGMIFSPRHGVINFSVPLFGDFLRRQS